jgi:hypothetical protein
VQEFLLIGNFLSIADAVKLAGHALGDSLTTGKKKPGT